MKILLLPFSLLFYLIIGLRHWLYEWGFFKSRRLESPVLCVGNLSTGGTGKTPWVQWITEHFLNRNQKVVILSRGYNGDYDGILKVDAEMDPRQCGDEPLWLKKNSRAEIYLGRNRYQAGLKAMANEKPDLFVLDDGFQHRALYRDLDLVLIDASASDLHELLLPMGYLREPFSALSRAQMVIINKCNYTDKEQVERLTEKCAVYVDRQNIFHADFIFQSWEPLVSELSRDFDNTQCALACAVGNPMAVVKTLQERGIQPKETFIFPDHHYWKPDDIEKMTYKMKRQGLFDLLMTEKDAVKLARYKKHFKEMSIQLWVCKMAIHVHQGEDAFFGKLDQFLLKGSQ